MKGPRLRGHRGAVWLLRHSHRAPVALAGMAGVGAVAVVLDGLPLLALVIGWPLLLWMIATVVASTVHTAWEWGVGRRRVCCPVCCARTAKKRGPASVPSGHGSGHEQVDGGRS